MPKEYKRKPRAERTVLSKAEFRANMDRMRDRIEYWLVKSGRMAQILAQREANAKLYKTFRAHWLQPTPEAVTA